MILVILQVLQCKDVQVRFVPQVKGLRINDIISFAKTKFHIELYFAESKSGYIIPPRSFIWNIGKKNYQVNNIVNSIAPKEFNEFIENALDKREKMHVIMKRVKLVAKPEFAKLLKITSIPQVRLW